MLVNEDSRAAPRYNTHLEMPPKRVHKRPSKPAPKQLAPDEPGGPRFNADAFLYKWGPQSLPHHNGFRAAIEKAFDIDPTSDYVYRADPAAVTLPQAQVAIDHGSARGFHAFYLDENGLQVVDGLSRRAWALRY